MSNIFDSETLAAAGAIEEQIHLVFMQICEELSETYTEGPLRDGVVRLMVDAFAGAIAAHFPHELEVCKERVLETVSVHETADHYINLGSVSSVAQPTKLNDELIESMRGLCRADD